MVEPMPMVDPMPMVGSIYVLDPTPSSLYHCLCRRSMEPFPLVISSLTWLDIHERHAESEVLHRSRQLDHAPAEAVIVLAKDFHCPVLKPVLEHALADTLAYLPVVSGQVHRAASGHHRGRLDAAQGAALELVPEYLVISDSVGLNNLSCHNYLSCNLRCKSFYAIF